MMATPQAQGYTLRNPNAAAETLTWADYLPAGNAGQSISGSLVGINDSINNAASPVANSWQIEPGEEPMLDSSGALIPGYGQPGYMMGGESQGWLTEPGEEPMLDEAGNLIPGYGRPGYMVGDAGAGGRTITNADLPSGGGLPGGNIPMYGTGGAGISYTPNGLPLGVGTGGGGQQQQQSTQRGTSTSPPPRELPTPFGSKNFATNALPGDEGQPATGSKDTVFFMQRLKDLIENPSQTESSPAYQFLMDQGMNALNRTAGAKRKRFSGNTLLEAEKFGQGLASTQYQNLANVLQQALGRATGQYGQDVGRYLGEQGIIQGFGADSYNSWLNRQRDAGAQQSAQILSQLASSLGL